MGITDLKIDLLLNNNLLERYKEGNLDLKNILLIIFYLDDFLEIDETIKNRLINLVNEYKGYETPSLIFDNPDILINKDIYGNRKNIASLKYLEDLNQYVKESDLDIERLSSTYNSILELDKLYEKNNLNENNKNTIDKLFDIKYKLYSFKTKIKIENIINKYNQNRYKEKIKK